MQADERQRSLKIFHLFYVSTGFIFSIPAENRTKQNKTPELSGEDVFAGTCQDD